ncbi:glycosyltransferase family 39 protein [Candidatus Woesebacteria bacterium]|nr:glycosyltransferase family 39 protein [Candidatus Woesebacteria bacterium]
MRLKLLNSHYFPIAFIIILSLCIRLYKLPDLMPFIGDQAWFYLSARNALDSGNIPLVGITASRTWLHQGAFWTYILMPILKTSSHPAAPGYFSALLGSLTTFGLYAVLREITIKKTALIGALLYATSPLVVLSDRMPYHTSFTPLLTIGIFYSLWRVMHGNQRFWIVLVGLVSVMQNTNLAGFPVVYVLALFFAIGLILKDSWTTFSKKILLHAILVWLILMMPFLLYDVTHGFQQTLKFYGWIILEPFRALVASDSASFSPIMKFLSQMIHRLIFLPSSFLSIFFFLGMFVIALQKSILKKFSFKDPLVYTTIWTLLMLLIVIFGKTPSDAYVFTLFPLIIMMGAQVVSIFQSKWVLFLIAGIGFFNCISLVRSNYLMGVKGGYGAPLSARIALVKEVVSDSDGSHYAIKVVGPGSQFTSTGMYFDYISGWQGRPPVSKNPKKIYEIYEKDGILRWDRVPSP